jgi:hypothetical protein
LTTTVCDVKRLSGVGEQASTLEKEELTEMQQRMIRVADIERLQRTMEGVPEQRVEEVTTLQAVRMLSSQIHGMQAKGYGLPAIAELLSDNGVAVTAKTLKTYLSEARAAGGRKSRRKAKTHRPVGAGAAATGPATASKPAVEANAASGGAQAGTRGVAKGAPAATTHPTPTAPVLTPKGTARPSDDASSRRSAFVPKEDTRDI